MEDDEDVLKLLWLLLRPLVMTIVLSVAAICAVYYASQPKSSSSREPYWLNYDPTKRVEDIAELDYDNRMIIYRQYDTTSNNPQKKPRQQVSADADEGWNDWYDFDDYYDLYEYYHD